MARAIWKAFIQFGPVSVPVKLYTAVRDVRPHSHLLHDRDRQRLQQRMVCSEEATTVARDETVKGYEVSENEYVLVDPHELDVLEPDPSREIRVVEFVESGEVDPRYLDRTFFLGPDGESYVGVLEERDGLLRLMTHRHADEVVPEDSLAIRQAAPSKREVAIARTLVEELQEPFQPERYHDEYEAKLRNLIEQKAQGQEVKLPRPKPVAPTKDEDLVGVLEMSLNALKR
jgi:DNA end-binding protein Ku